MNLIEKHYESYLRNRTCTRNLQELTKNRIEIIDKNLRIYEMSDNREESSPDTFRSQISADDCANSVVIIPEFSYYKKSLT